MFFPKGLRWSANYVRPILQPWPNPAAFLPYGLLLNQAYLVVPPTWFRWYCSSVGRSIGLVCVTCPRAIFGQTILFWPRGWVTYSIIPISRETQHKKESLASAVPVVVLLVYREDVFFFSLKETFSTKSSWIWPETAHSCLACRQLLSASRAARRWFPTLSAALWCPKLSPPILQYQVRARVRQCFVYKSAEISSTRTIFVF